MKKPWYNNHLSGLYVCDSIKESCSYGTVKGQECQHSIPHKGMIVTVEKGLCTEGGLCPPRRIEVICIPIEEAGGRWVKKGESDE